MPTLELKQGPTRFRRFDEGDLESNITQVLIHPLQSSSRIRI